MAKGNKKGAKAIEAFGIKALNAECKSCYYYNKLICLGQFSLINTCIFVKPYEGEENNDKGA